MIWALANDPPGEKIIPQYENVLTISKKKKKERERERERERESESNNKLFEPVREKTNSLVFRPGPTQTSLYSREEEGLYYPCSENKGADQLRDYAEAGLRLCFRP